MGCHPAFSQCDSYRLREKRRSGLFRPQTGGTSPPVAAKED